jgi:ElaB/YqjD/DUF883 family membrane-anchored ribosome-binding protein
MPLSPTASRSNDASTDHANPTTDRLAATQQETIDRIADEANDVRRRMRGVAASAAVTARRAQDRVVEAVRQNLPKARSYIERNPLTTVGIAFAAGAVLSRLIRR